MKQLYHNIFEYSYSGKADWLNDFYWEVIPFEPMKFGAEGICTACYFAVSNKIKVASDVSGDVYFGSVIHELYHAYQRHTMGLMKYLLMKTFRRKKLEAPAKQAELEATQWAGEQRIKQWKEKHEK